MSPDGARTSLLNRFQRGDPVLGTIVGSTDSAVTDILGAVGFDFVILDNEHSPMSPETALHHVRAAETRHMIPFARVLENSQTLIQKFLDIGCQGIVVPHVDTRDDAERAVAATRFAPGGKRGMCPCCHAAGYAASGWVSFSGHSQENVMVIPIIESLHAVENIREIVAVEGIDLVFFGRGDLAQEMGVVPLGWGSPELRAAWQQVRAAAHAAGKYVMTGPQTATADAVRELHEQGANAVCCSMDLLIFYQAAAAIVARKQPTTPTAPRGA